MGEAFVVDASPLIALGGVGRLDVLLNLAPQVVIPGAVAEEVRRGADEASRALAAASVRIVQVEPEPLVIAWGLGHGETGVLSFARQHDGFVAVLDDLAARRCASPLRVPVRGTIGLVLLARSRGIIPSAREVLLAIRQSGFHMSDQLLDHALALVGEGRQT